MCLIIAKDAQPIRAKKDIKVYKLLTIDSEGNLISAFQRTPYAIGETYQVEMKVSLDSSHMDNRDSMYLTKMFGSDWMNGYSTKAIGPGLHCVSDPSRLVGESYVYVPVLVECIIPEGSLYYDNGDMLLVSNCLKLIRQIRYPKGFNQESF